MSLSLGLTVVGNLLVVCPVARCYTCSCKLIACNLLMKFAGRQQAQAPRRKMWASELPGSTEDTFRTSKRPLNHPSETPLILLFHVNPVTDASYLLQLSYFDAGLLSYVLVGSSV